MEKDGLLGNFNWQPGSCNTSPAATELIHNNNNNINSSGSCDNGNHNGCGVDQSSMMAATSSFLNLNWDKSSTDQTGNFESALSSLVSSPSSSSPPNPNHPASADSLVIRELIGRLGSICNNDNNNNNSSNVSQPNSSHYQSTNTSCYTTPLNSPPKLNLLSVMDNHPQFQLTPRTAAAGGSVGNNNNRHTIPFGTDPAGFTERAGAASARNYAELGLQEPGKLSRASSSQSLMGVNVNRPDSMHLQQQLPQPLDGMGSGVGGQLENDMVMMMTMISSGGELGSSNAHAHAHAHAHAQEETSASDRMAPNVNLKEGIARKRKVTSSSSNKGSSSSSSSSRGRGKEAPTPNPDPNPVPNPPKAGEAENFNSKRRKSGAAAEAETGADGAGKGHAVKTPKAEEQNSTGSESAQKQNKDKNNNEKPPEPTKQDYIHVRARRGQATDSHSLAERVRREKISERMKFLQDLVPGCNKVTGKAVMLDEIINYVQSLQRQVEFLSMKLATVNPRLDVDVDSLLPKDIHHPRGPMMAPLSSYVLEDSSNGFSYANQLQGQGQNPLRSLINGSGLETQCLVNNPLDASSLLRGSLGLQLPSLEGFTDAAAASQLGAFWEDDLQSVVGMGFGQNPEAIFSSHSLQGLLPTSHMKIEL